MNVVYSHFQTNNVTKGKSLFESTGEEKVSVQEFLFRFTAELVRLVEVYTQPQPVLLHAGSETTGLSEPHCSCC